MRFLAKPSVNPLKLLTSRASLGSASDFNDVTQKARRPFAIGERFGSKSRED
jgi:hypothetical protein